jgi:hypothetical protein
MIELYKKHLEAYRGFTGFKDKASGAEQTEANIAYWRLMDARTALYQTGMTWKEVHQLEKEDQ